MVKIDLEDMIDICTGRMDAKDIIREIKHYLFCKEPSKMVVTIEKNKKMGDFYSVFYVPIKKK